MLFGSISFQVFIVVAALMFVASGVAGQSMFRRINDFDGDGKADFAVTRNEGGLKVWYIWQTSAGVRRIQFGLANDSLVAGDYDGDRKTDIAVQRTIGQLPYNYHTFFILQSQTGDIAYKSIIYPAGSGYANLQQDYDGDGRIDPAMLITEGTGGSLIYRRSTTESNSAMSIPSSHFATRLGDMDGDGNTEVSSYNPTTNLVTLRNPATGNTRSFSFGTTGDEYVPADFDGDGIGDLTIFRGSSGDWWWLRSSDMVVNVDHWGVSGDRPVGADYDNDGKTDRAVYRPGSPNGTYYINGSLTGLQAFRWGIAGDQLVRY
jgi:hypothetical protein